MKTIKDIDEINEIKNQQLIVLIAKTKTCSVCKPISERLEKLMEAYPNIPLYSVLIDEVEEFRGQFLVFSVPTVLIFSEGKELLRESRFVELKNVKRLLDIYQS